jgi:hypothetical protein
MPDDRTVQHCHYAEPTLFLDDPSWTASEEFPWSCRADGDPHLVTDTTRCATCDRWVPRDRCDCWREERRR